MNQDDWIASESLPDSNHASLLCDKYFIGTKKVSKCEDLLVWNTLRQQSPFSSKTDIPVDNSKHCFKFVCNKIKNTSLQNGVNHCNCWAFVRKKSE